MSDLAHLRPNLPTQVPGAHWVRAPSVRSAVLLRRQDRRCGAGRHRQHPEGEGMASS